MAARVTAAFLDPYVTDWLDLLIRWLHVVAAIAWIGSSFYFIGLDNHLEPPQDERDAEQGVAGEAWEIHGGGFYHVQKYRVAPPALPDRLLWFKWEAYTTWLSGFALLVVLYYFNASTHLVDPSVAKLSDWEAVGISAAGLVLAWVVYDGLCRVLAGRDLWLGAAILAFTALSARGAGELLAPRAAYLQVGAMLGTMMAGNVLFVIIPAHWDLVRAKEAGREPDPAAGLRGKQRSVHNNYLTLPVVLTMISGHFAFTYGHAHAWLILVALMLIGAWVRHYFNLRHSGRNAWWILASAGVALVALAVTIRPDDSSPGTAAPVSFAQVRSIVDRRCVTCHSMHPTSKDFKAPPLGITFDTREQIEARAQQIKAVAVDSTVMPLGNVTGMTDEERRVLGAWIDQTQVGSATCWRSAPARSSSAPASRSRRRRSPSPRSGTCSRWRAGSSTSAGAGRAAGSRWATSTSGSAPRTRPATRARAS
jgi:uncharacterized membrane protein